MRVRRYVSAATAAAAVAAGGRAAAPAAGVITPSPAAGQSAADEARDNVEPRTKRRAKRHRGDGGSLAADAFGSRNASDEVERS